MALICVFNGFSFNEDFRNFLSFSAWLRSPFFSYLRHRMATSTNLSPSSRPMKLFFNYYHFLDYIHSASFHHQPTKHDQKKKEKKNKKQKKSFQFWCCRGVLPAARVYIITVIFASLSPARMQCTNTDALLYIKGDKK